MSKSRPSTASNQQNIPLFADIFVIVAMAFMFTWPSIINNFPLVFYDTSTYLIRAKAGLDLILHQDTALLQVAGNARHTSGPGTSGYVGSTNPFFLRPFTYSAFLVPFASGLTFAAAPFAHGLIAAYILKRLFSVLGVVRNQLILAMGATLALLSSLPIQVSYVMPDVFTGLAIIASFATVLAWRTRSRVGRVIDILLMTFLFAVHLSHIPIALALIVMHGAIWLVFRGPFSLKSVAACLVAPLAIAIAALVSSNIAVANKAVISESSSLFLQARLIGDGPGLEQLRASCPTKKYVLCSELDRLTASDDNGSISDFFLWSPNGAVKRVGNEQLVSEAAEINSDTLRAYPLEIAQHATSNFARQLFKFQVDDDSNNPPADFLVETFRRVGQPLPAQFLDSLQSHGRFPLETARLLTNLGLIIAGGAIGYIVLFRRKEVSTVSWLFFLIAATGIGANALAIGALSEVHDRYQNRVIWLIPVIAIALASSAFSRQTNRASSSIQDGATVGQGEKTSAPLTGSNL